MREPGLGERCAAWLSRLVRIPSVTPAQAGPRSGAPGEARLAESLAEWFAALGGEVFVEEALPGRPNVYGLWRGSTRRRAALDVHMDTVGVEQMEGDPFSGALRDGRVFGRGAVDTKASLAVALALLELLWHAGAAPEAHLLVAATVDEEDGARGAPAFASWARRRGITIDELMVAEPTGCRPVYGHKGVVRLEFTVEGRAAHSAQPERGLNAIVGAARLALAFDDEHQRLAALGADSALGLPTLTPTLIDGGSGLNIVPDRCALSVDRRVVAGERAEAVAAGLCALAEAACPLPVRARQILALDAFLQDPGVAWVGQLEAWSGMPADIAPYGTNAWAYDGLAGACAVLGPGSIAQAHGAVEWVEVAELERLAEIYARWWGGAELLGLAGS